MKKKKMKKVLLVAVLAVIISTVTYAWFSVKNKAGVNNLAISAGTEGNLLIADDTGNGPAEYSSELDLRMIDGSYAECTLNPVTTIEGREFYAPVYSGGKVVNVKKITSEAELTNKYIYEKQFYLKVENEGRGNDDEYYIYLTAHTGDKGTFMTDIAADDANGDTAANAIRISFTIDDETVIYEPNFDGDNYSNELAEDLVVSGGYNSYNTVKQIESGIFADSNNGNDSEYLFKIPADTDKLVTMRVWIEGKDKDCANSIELDKIFGYIEFSSVSIRNATVN